MGWVVYSDVVLRSCGVILVFVVTVSRCIGDTVSNYEIVRMARSSRCMDGCLLLSYLGMPIGSDMIHVVSWKVSIDRSKAKLSGWKASLLSIGPLTVIKEHEKLCASFFWGASEDNKKLA
ncbi:hypothetical protein Tco_0174216 [Tanacetum coccineum]